MLLFMLAEVAVFIWKGELCCRNVNPVYYLAWLIVVRLDYCNSLVAGWLHQAANSWISCNGYCTVQCESYLETIVENT